MNNEKSISEMQLQLIALLRRANELVNELHLTNEKADRLRKELNRRQYGEVTTRGVKK